MRHSILLVGIKELDVSTQEKKKSSKIRLKDHQIYSQGEGGRDLNGNGSGAGGLRRLFASGGKGMESSGPSMPFDGNAGF